MIKFKKVSRLAAADFNLPVRKTKNSAGYDFEVAEDIIIPTFAKNWDTLIKSTPIPIEETFTLNEVASLTKGTKAKPTLVSTGVKCYLEPGYYLELSVRSSTPLKYWLVLANSVGIIDADYCDNPDNEGEIFFQIINLSPFPIQLHKGDIIGQGIIKRYEVTDDDAAEGERSGGFGSTSVPNPTGVNSAMDNNLQMSLDINNALDKPNRGLRTQAGVYDEVCLEAERVSECLKESIMGKTLFDASM